MSSFLNWLLPGDFMPHGHCYLWRPDVLWLHVGSDAVIAGAYFAIPVALGYFVRRRRAVLPYWWVPALFATFIFLCGSTHVLSIWTVWNPDYVVDGLVKLATAVASAATAVMVFAALPQALALRTPIELQREVDHRTAELVALNERLHREIEARQRTESALRESEGRFRATFENAAVGIAHVAPDGRWLQVNAVLCELTGYSRGELLNRTFGDITHPEDLQKDWDEARQLLAGEQETYSIEKRYIRKDGRILWTVLTVSLVRDAQRQPAYFISVVLDISARKQLEEELRHTIQRLADTDRRKDEFLATLAHELRNPLAPIANGVQIIKRCEPGDPVKRTAVMIERQLQHLVRLVDDLLDVSRITRGKAPLRRESLSLQQVLLGALESSRPALDARHLQIETQLPEQILAVEGDRDRLTQVFSNILSNAAKFTGAGGSVSIRAAREDDTAVVSITDTGIGIPPEALETVFEMFSQLRVPEHGEGGLGIGLALVRQLVQLHGGTVEARSEGAGRGSEFIVRLPIFAGAATAPQAASVDESSPDAHRVLVVDDNRDAAESLRALLQLMGHDVRQASDGVEAVETAREFVPDVIFMDIGMPRMNGLEATRRIRDLPLGTRPYIIALTGWGQDGDRERSRQAGIDHHLIKPIDHEALRAVLQLAAAGRPG